MHVSHSNYTKEPNIIRTIARNTSCNRGWLRLMVQIVFGSLITSSFILIMLTVIGKPIAKPTFSSRCAVFNCRITCNDAPFYGEFEDDIINAASEVDVNCDSIVLKLIQPTFRNFEIPENWLSRMRSNVRELSIVGGNIKFISPHAFMSPFSNNIRVLILEEIEISVWENNMFVGLSNLKKLFLIDCILHDIRHGALTSVDDSLQFLDIKASNIFDPVNVTGSVRLLGLSLVDFSQNNFRNILTNNSFSKLKACKVLFLNSCQIVSLGPGTFDNLESIEILYLNDNFLVTVPVGLFDRILPRMPRIALEENYWHCDCSAEDLRAIYRKDLLIVDPICHYPETLAGITFSDFEGYCTINYIKNVEITDHLDVSRTHQGTESINEIIYMNGACPNNNFSRIEHFKDNVTFRIIAPTEQQNCLLNRINTHDIKTIASKFNSALLPASTNWIKPVFYVQNRPYSMIEIASSAMPGYGLLWYQSSCADEVYCVNTVPNVLKLFNIDLSNYYTFCLFNLSSGAIMKTQCVSYDLANIEKNSHFTFNYHDLILYICISLVCLICGAVCVYALIQRNPSLLKGSKRVLLVKHRSVEALILPPKLPMRKLLEPSSKLGHLYEKNKVFVLPQKLDTLRCPNFARSVSMKSNESNEASYISALQPTEEQLTEWRSNQIVNQFDNTPSAEFSVLPYSSTYDQESLPYYSLHSAERVYEVPKHY